ncbi:MAG TPA: hypothetical protein VF739_11015, partial [Ktedonobacterales bacterium]
TGLMALTLWLAGAVTIAGQPIIEPSGVVVGALSGSVRSLMVDDILVFGWALSGSFLYMNFLYPQRTPRQRMLRRMLLMAHLLILFSLLMLARAASADPQVLREGVWFPVRAGMPPAAVVYDLIGKTYILGMQVWACIGCWQSMRRLPFAAMRAAVGFGLCVASAVFVQGLAVTVAQARGQQFFAPPDGPHLNALWLGLGLLCPLAAFGVAGAFRRWRLMLLRRDLLALRRRLIQPESAADRVDGTLATDSAPQRFTVWLKVWLGSLAHPVADVDRLCVEIRDLLATRYPIPTEATALAGVWLWSQSRQRIAQLSQRDIALLLLGATILGIEQGITDPAPLDYPEPVLQRFAEDTDWNIPADARFLQTVERLLEDEPVLPEHALVCEGLRDVSAQLQGARQEESCASTNRATGEAIPTLIESWLGTVEMAQREGGATLRGGNGADHQGCEWWQPLPRKSME